MKNTTRSIVTPSLLVGAIVSIAAAQTGSNDCSTPDTIGGLGAFPFVTTGATTDGTPATMCNFFNNSQIYNDVWFCWTASESGLLAFETCGSGWDTKLAVYAGCSPCPDESTILACNDDAACSVGGTLQSRVTLAVSAGESYTVRVGAYSATGSGSGTLTIASGAIGELINPANGHRYIMYPATGWLAAEATAVALGGHLVTINDAEENEWIRTEFGTYGGVNRRTWIGYNDVAIEGQFEWSSGEAATFSNWNAGEPNNAGAGEHYAEFFGDVGLWNDMPENGGTAAHVALAEIGDGGGGSSCAGDLDRDGWVSGSDLSALLGNWGGAGTGDIDGDGTISGSDLAAMLGNWGQCQ